MFFVLVIAIYIIILKNENNLCQNVEITLGANGWCQWIWSLGVVSVWWIYFLHYNEGTLLLLYLCFFVNYFILVFVTLLYLSNFIREKISMERCRRVITPTFRVYRL